MGRIQETSQRRIIIQLKVNETFDSMDPSNLLGEGGRFEGWADPKASMNCLRKNENGLFQKFNRKQLPAGYWWMTFEV
jgi:hypothetical protein